MKKTIFKKRAQEATAYVVQKDFVPPEGTKYFRGDLVTYVEMLYLLHHAAVWTIEKNEKALFVRTTHASFKVSFDATPF